MLAQSVCTNLLLELQEFLTSVDTDKQAVSDQMDGISARWESLEHLIDNSAKTLEAKASKLSEQHDILNDVTKQVKECEDILASHNALGTNAYDSKHMDHIKVLTLKLYVYNNATNYFGNTYV